jgi:hypothetical protein
MNQGAHSIGQAFEDFRQLHSPEIVYPIFGFLRRVVFAFPVLESREAIDAFVWVVGKLQTETVTKERDSLTARSSDPKRLQTPVLRALRHIRDYYFDDVRDGPNDAVVQRIPRWGKEVQTLPVYKGKIDVPHPAALAWDYDFLHGVCKHVNEEIGLNDWKKYAEQFPQHDPVHPAIPYPLWDKGERVTVNVPDDATPSEAAYGLLSAKTGLSRERLRKLIQEGHNSFPEQVVTTLQQRWEKAYIDPKLGIIRVPLDDEKDGPEFDLHEELSFGFSVETLFPIER